MKKFFILLLKIGISALIIGYLMWQARENDAFTILRDQPKQWGLLALAWCFCMLAVLTTIVRWHLLIRALKIPSRFAETLRLGFLGFMFNLAPLGIIGGDAIKAVMLAREHKNAQAKSVASVMVDRLIGLYMVFVVASVAIAMSDLPARVDDPLIVKTFTATYWIAGLGAVAFVLLMIPAVSDGKLVRAIERLPRVGHPIHSLMDALRMYRRRPLVLFIAALMTTVVHSSFAVGIYLIASGLYANVHSVADHLVMSPLSAATGVIPLPLGPYELVLDRFYSCVPLAGAVVPSGLVVALGYRLITVLIAAIGACYYIGARQDVSKAIHETGPEESDAEGTNLVLSKKTSSATAA